MTQFGVAFVFATLLALASLLLCPQVALAQGAPVGWTIVLDNSGTKSGDSIATAPPQIRTLTNDHSNPIVWSHRDGNAAVSLNVTVKLKWNGNGVPTAPPKSVLIQASAFGTVYGYQNGNPSASNGFSDLVSVVPNGSPYYGTSASTSGKHIVKVPANSGTEIIVGSWSLSASGTPDVNTSFSAVIDPREVFITSNIEPNYHRMLGDPPGQGRQELNLRMPNGDMNVDCLAPCWWLQAILPVTITYYGNAFGWSINSAYSWSSSLGSLGSTAHGGYFNPWLLQSDTGYYFQGNVRSGTTDTILLTVQDGNDSAKAEGRYTVKFHDTYDDPKAITNTIDRPRSYLQHPEDWQGAGSFQNISAGPISTTITVKFSQQLGWKLSLNSETKVPPVLASIFSKATIGGEMSSSTTQEYSQAVVVIVPAGTKAIMYGATQNTSKQGYCSHYGYSGYIGDTPFSGTEYGAIAIAGPELIIP